MLFALLISCFLENVVDEDFFPVSEDEEDEDFIPLLKDEEDEDFFNVLVENEDLVCSFHFFRLLFDIVRFKFKHLVTVIFIVISIIY